MTATRRRRIARRAVMALAVVVLLPVGYVGSVAAIEWQSAREDWLRSDLLLVRRSPVFEAYESPMHMYLERELPGHRELTILLVMYYERGSGGSMTWSEIAAEQDELAARDP